MAITPEMKKFRVSLLNRSGRAVKEQMIEGVSHEIFGVNENHNVFVMYGPNKEQLHRIGYPIDWVVVCELFEAKAPKKLKVVTA